MAEAPVRSDLWEFEPAVQETGEEAAWLIQLRWFSSIGILEIRLRWLAAVGVLLATWFAGSVLNVPLLSWPLYGIGACMLVYNMLLWLFLERAFSYPSLIRSSGYDYPSLLRYFWREIEAEGEDAAARFDRLVKVQTSLDWLITILLVYLSGGLVSPLLFYFVFHLIIASILLSRRASYAFASLAAAAVGVLGLLEYVGLLPHVSLWSVSDALYQDAVYVAAVLFFFVTSLYLAVYFTTTLTKNLRAKDEELLKTQQRLSEAYQLIQTLYGVTRTVSSTLRLEEVLDLIARSAAEAVELKACSIMLLVGDSPRVDRVASFGLSEAYLGIGPIELGENRYLDQALASGQATFVDDAARELHLQYPVETREEGIVSILCVPLLVRGKAEGVVCVYGAQAGQFSEQDADFLLALASSGATAIENARAYEALEAADRAKSEFVRMVSHELRSPLSAVQSILRLLEQGIAGPLTVKQLDLIGRSERRIQALLGLVKDLLELAAGKMELLQAERHEVDLAKLLVKVTDLMQGRAVEKGLDYAVEIANVPLVAMGVEDSLERVFVNLVSNAVKYTPAGGSVTVRAGIEHGHIIIDVSDTGIGIPEEALPRIFSEFYRAKNAKALEVEGTGLGLAIARDAVEQHGGRLSVDSQVGKGSTFRVVLPEGVGSAPSREERTAVQVAGDTK